MNVSGKSVPLPSLSLLTVEQLNTLPPLEWQVKHTIEVGSHVVVYGPPGVVSRQVVEIDRTIP
jgi:hypothetical protein